MIVCFQEAQNGAFLGRLERIAGLQNLALDQPAVSFMGRRVPPGIEIQFDVGIDAGVAAVGKGIFAVGRIRLVDDFLLPARRQRGDGGEQGREDPKTRWAGHGKSYVRVLSH